MGNVITNTDPGNFTVDGVYIDQVPATTALPSGPATNLICLVGGGNDGPVNTPTGFVDQPSAFAAFGNDTTSVNSLLRAALNAMPEGANFLGVRVTDGTDTAATIKLTSVSPSGTLVTLTRNNTGSFANGASAIISLQSGATSGSPIYNVQITYPQAQSESFTVAGYATAGAGYSASAFIANLVSAVNGQTRNVAGSKRWTASAGSATGSVQTGVVFQASGGTDGTANITSAELIGVAAYEGATGMNALNGLCSAGIVLLCGPGDGSQAQAFNTFLTQQNAIGGWANPQGSSTASAIALRAEYDIATPNIFNCVDWDYVADATSGLTLLTPPHAKIAGIISSLPAYQYVGNQPVAGAAGVSATERIVNGLNSVGAAEASQRQLNGLIYLGAMPRYSRGPQLGLPHGMMSDGATRINDARMLKMITAELLAALGPVVGEAMSVASGNLGQPALGLMQDLIDTYFGNLLNGTPQQISAYNPNYSNNTQSSVAQGVLIANVSVTTLSAAQFILTLLQVGVGVQIVTQTAA